jgi:hypothetical protein
LPEGFFWALVAKFLREPHVGAKRAKHRAKRSPECGDPNVVRARPKCETTPLNKIVICKNFTIYSIEKPRKRGRQYIPFISFSRVIYLILQ